MTHVLLLNLVFFIPATCGALVAWRLRKLRAFSRLPQTSIEHQARLRLRDLS